MIRNTTINVSDELWQRFKRQCEQKAIKSTYRLGELVKQETERLERQARREELRREKQNASE